MRDKNNETVIDELPAVAIVDSRTLEDKIYIVRGVQVMLDFELAEYYGYTTGKMNERVKENAARFRGEEFRFQLTKAEFENLKSEIRISSWGGRRYLPYAFTEQGIYMLMTVLKGTVAVEQSRELVRMFKNMREHISNNPLLAFNQQLLSISSQTADNAMAIKRIEGSMVTYDDLSDFIKLFDRNLQNDEILVLDGRPFKADIAYQEIYKSAKKSIIVIDDYIGVKTLHHLAHANDGVEITIISDNKGTKLRKSEYDDFLVEYPKKTVRFIKSSNRAHDRYIIIDTGTKFLKVYHCGASSKDAGKRITTITRLADTNEYKPMIDDLWQNEELILK